MINFSFPLDTCRVKGEYPLNMNEQLKILHNKIYALISAEVESNNVSYNKVTPYQSYERINFKGLRWSVEKRISEYGLKRFFDPEFTILDIGSNFGFFVCEFAMHCKLVHGIEPNPHLIKISKATASHLGIAEKTIFFDILFEDFVSPVTYDVVLSLATFYTQDGRERSSATKYFNRIAKLLSSDGQVFYESTSYKKETKNPHFIAQEMAINALQETFSSVETWETDSGSKKFFRRFAIGKKPRLSTCLNS